MVECAQEGNTLTGVCKDLVVCVGAATTSNDFVQDHLDGSGIHLIEATDTYDYNKEFMDGTCNVCALEPAGHALFEKNLRDAGYTGEYQVGSRLFSKEPLASVMRGDDPQWADFVGAVLQALFSAELESISQQTSALFPESDFFGEEYKYMYQNAIAAVGNWGEIYNRTFGALVPRVGQNLLVSQVEGEFGMLYSPPFSSLTLKPTLETDVLPEVVPNGTMDKIGQRGSLRCGILSGRPGFAAEAPYNNSGGTTWAGLDIDLCHCLATALFNGVVMVDFVELEDSTAGYSALANDVVDVVIGIPYSLRADIQEPSTMKGFAFSPVYFYGQNGDMLTLATNQKEAQWSDFVRWTIYGLIFAEENGIGRDEASQMPSIDLFGPSFRLMFRLMVLNFGNYGDLYKANLEEVIPRQGHNMLNDGSSPLINPLPISEFASI